MHGVAAHAGRCLARLPSSGVVHGAPAGRRRRPPPTAAPGVHHRAVASPVFDTATRRALAPSCAVRTSVGLAASMATFADGLLLTIVWDTVARRSPCFIKSVTNRRSKTALADASLRFVASIGRNHRRSAARLTAPTPVRFRVRRRRPDAEGPGHSPDGHRRVRCSSEFEPTRTVTNVPPNSGRTGGKPAVNRMFRCHCPLKSTPTVARFITMVS